MITDLQFKNCFICRLKSNHLERGAKIKSAELLRSDATWCPSHREVDSFSEIMTVQILKGHLERKSTDRADLSPA